VDGPRDSVTWALVAVAVAFTIASNLTPISESDFWIQLKVGDEIRRNGAIPRTIEYAFTEARDREFIAHEWLPSTITSALYPRVGYAGMIVFKCALAATVVGLAFALAFRINRSTVTSVLVACATATAMNFRFQMRPELIAFVFATASLYLLTAFVQTGRRAWLIGLVPIALVWANSHGSFVVGLLLPWMFLAGAIADDLWIRRGARRSRVYSSLAAAGAAMAAISLATPFGLKLFTQVLAVGRADWLRDNIVEFGATFDPRTTSQPFFWVYVVYAGAVLASLVAGRRRVDGTSLILVLIFGWMSIRSIRYTAWFALAGTYVVAQSLAAPRRALATERRIAAAGIVVLLAGLGVVAARGDVRGHRVGFRNEAPMSEAALEFVRSAGIEGNVFNTFSHGDQLVHAFYPRIRVAIDSRTDAYGEAYYLRYRALCGRSFKALGPPGDLLAFIDRHDVRAIVTRPVDFKNWSDKGHVDALAGRGWYVAFSDPTTLVLRRPL
jgi:hypothetical protein